MSLCLFIVTIIRCGIYHRHTHGTVAFAELFIGNASREKGASDICGQCSCESAAESKKSAMGATLSNDKSDTSYYTGMRIKQLAIKTADAEAAARICTNDLV